MYNTTEIPELNRLGTNYYSIMKVQPRIESGVIQLISCPVSVVLVVWWAIFVFLVFSFLFYAGLPQAADASLVTFIIGLIAMLGPAVMVHFYNAQCSRENPVIEIDLNRNLVAVSNHQKTFSLSSVHALVAVTFVGSDYEKSTQRYRAEMQLLINSNNTITAELVCTKLDTADRAFGKALSAIRSHCPFPTMVVGDCLLADSGTRLSR